MTCFKHIKVLFSAFLACFLLVACATQTNTAELTPSLEVSLTSLPSATIEWFPATETKPSPSEIPGPVIASIEPTQRGDLIFMDDFSDKSLWQTQKGTEANISYETNALSVAISGDQIEALSLSQHTLPESFHLEFTIETALCSDDDQYGIIFWRNSASGTYRFWANWQGDIMVSSILQGGSTRSVNWQSARKLAPSAPSRNVFGIQAHAGELNFYVNDTYQFSLKTRPDLQGALGVIARSAGSTALTVRFSELKVTK